jgi:hypothetical protein
MNYRCLTSPTMLSMLSVLPLQDITTLSATYAVSVTLRRLSFSLLRSPEGRFVPVCHFWIVSEPVKDFLSASTVPTVVNPMNSGAGARHSDLLLIFFEITHPTISSTGGAFKAQVYEREYGDVKRGVQCAFNVERGNRGGQVGGGVPSCMASQ